MAPAQEGPSIANGKLPRDVRDKRNAGKKRKGKQKSIMLDPTALIFLATRLRHDACDEEQKHKNNDEEDETRNPIQPEFISAVLETVKPALFLALDTRVYKCFTC